MHGVSQGSKTRLIPYPASRSVFGHLCFTKVEGNEGKSMYESVKMDQHYHENLLKPPSPLPNKFKECKFVVTVISWLNNNEEKVFFRLITLTLMPILTTRGWCTHCDFKKKIMS